MSTINNGFYPRVSRLFASLPVTLLIGFLRNVIAMLTGNTSYLTPPPNPTLAEMKTAVDDLEAKNQAAMNGGRVEIATRNAAQVSTLNLARQLANYVESQANGALDVLLSSGFEAIRAPGPVSVPKAPTNPTLTQGDNSGVLLFRFGGDFNVRNFTVQHAESLAGPWVDDGLSTKTRVTLEGLTPGKVYFARACANGAGGSSDYCPPTSGMAV